ncbi:hypothetical protein FGO68_gene15551 [Halteria grandinella]|uniref:Uncharacterized protein n=1 Tax=Halteria grandinella TaxID=5974 RepID=A0A8J8T2R6_HALGN|nr:hypothetical protein FGO68_gene15551 [Halteria grandinella]
MKQLLKTMDQEQQKIEISSKIYPMYKDLSTVIKQKRQALQTYLNKNNGVQSEVDVIKDRILEMRAIFQALYIGICPNLSQQCELELFESVKSEAQKQLFEVSEVIEKMYEWVNIELNPVKIILSRKFRPILLLDPCSYYKEYKQDYKIQKYKQLDLHQIDSGIVYRCSYERPSLSAEVYERFTVVNMEKLIGNREKRTKGKYEFNTAKDLEKQLAQFKKEYQELEGMIVY